MNEREGVTEQTIIGVLDIDSAKYDTFHAEHQVGCIFYGDRADVATEGAGGSDGGKR